ncbi:hypothetical protein HMPREF3171_02345 [Corynebacterium sp. HMSC08F01]|uniref:DUF3068 domain-containing protein n=1 Tax=Corynebacterium coyleae TaxID=53374 RepID=A0AAP7CC96_9CORY|nr:MULTISPECIES: DUF3068 domain-containing protein [Corynebacterium]MDK8824066.1 DUF3068 domain-containing protein [Corynebacterium coyleae]NJJ03333.1 DUF3068 domain-containing protein [Corynebacterium coyleae]OFL14358.1 hypothetical protein HMPREF2785_03410 [Corynebacterium sp. HMSC067D03]OFT31708.1 hypothetical protein HMPREF3171_02345 [Corynebacterium sp. HMSC08F01]OFT68809.1 hypothetical protein HMPREF3145_07945 [Corynebacterium sp. HMSC05C01]
MLRFSRSLAALVAGVGIALVVAGMLAPRVLLSGERLPLALGDATWTITDPDGMRAGESAPVTRQLHLEVMEPSGDERAAIRVGDSVRAGEAPGDFENLVSATTWSYELDRVSGEALSPAQAQVIFAMPAAQVAVNGVWLKFPSPAPASDVDVFDPVLRGSAVARFVDTQEIGGRTVNRYQQTVAPTNIAQRYADPRNTLTIDGERTFFTHAAERELLVDEQTGVVVGINERVDDYYADAEGNGVQNVLTYDGRMDEAQVTELVQRVGQAQPKAANPLLWWIVTGVGAVLALVGLIGSVVSARRN